MNDLLKKLGDNMVFVIQFLLIIAVIFAVAYFAEKRVDRKKNYTGRILTTKKIAVIGLFSAISAILMLFEIPLPFAPSFYKLDFSELPVLIVTFAFGPVAGVLTEFVKIILKLLFKSTTTAFVGELANFAVGCSFILPASFIYLEKKTRKRAIISCIAGTLSMTVFGSVFNAVYLLPKFAAMYGMPLDKIVEMAAKINPAVTSVSGIVLFAVVPLNLLKGGLVSLLTMLLYKKLSPVMKHT